jgi:hypothetical protein
LDVCEGLDDRPNRAFLKTLDGCELLYKNGSAHQGEWKDVRSLSGDHGIS